MASGLSGAVRVVRLTASALAAAERHGKRQDASGKSRAIYEADAVTTSGLDLRSLYDQHVATASVPKGATKALHVLIQYPTELVDGEDPLLMLAHARAFGEEIFGNEAIFADRLDRDEKGRHVVDLFVAPIYQKITKRTSKRAVSISRDLKNLAVERGKWVAGKYPAPLALQGQALQDAFHDYLVGQMGLVSAERGKSKARPGSDWRSAEELEASRLRAEAEAIAANIKDHAVLDRRKARLYVSAMETEFNQTIVDRDEAAAAKAGAVADWRAAKGARDDALYDAHQARSDRAEAAAAKVAAAAARQAAEADQLLAAKARNEVVRSTVRVRTELAQATASRQAADVDQQIASALRLGLEGYADGRILSVGGDNQLKINIPNADLRDKFIEDISPAWDQIYNFVRLHGEKLKLQMMAQVKELWQKVQPELRRRVDSAISALPISHRHLPEADLAVSRTEVSDAEWMRQIAAYQQGKGARR